MLTEGIREDTTPKKDVLKSNFGKKPLLFVKKKKKQNCSFLKDKCKKILKIIIYHDVAKGIFWTNADDNVINVHVPACYI